MTAMHEPFKLEEGARIFVPDGELSRCRSRHADTHPETPVVFLLRNEAGKKFSFKRRDDYDGSSAGFTLFAPGGVQSRDILVVVWVDKTCACVRKASPDEAIDATASGHSHHDTV